ncbi:hypothetical protein JSY36_12460 [Bacillus sp. H-16]|uniref:N-acetylglucosamine kinase n=1 Tax=Alteribacter salitolerans TaxID=2912333 RepID=UPI001965FDC8|nr:BadF/BadG/BcrA/BcrD ATPase family protein [Alteribacter salitolerans]MBM7096559.1 hypothetical protein [Alteribacter salitolerans]
MYAIGIDGGGTKSKLMIKDREDQAVFSCTTGATNPTAVSLGIITERLSQLFNQTPSSFKEQAVSLCFGMSGFSALSQEDIQTIQAHIKTKLNPEAFVTVTNDAVTALYSGTQGNSGIAVIAGTGSVVYGKDESGNEARAAGWGYMFDHSGSGFGIGKAALKAVMNEADSGMALSSFSEMILQSLSADNPRDIVTCLNHSQDPRHDVASLAPAVFSLYEQGNQAAEQLISQAAEDIYDSIQKVRGRLFTEQKAVTLVCTGSLFQKQQALFDALTRLTDTKGYRLSIPKAEPVEGAVYAAWEAVGERL